MDFLPSSNISLYTVRSKPQPPGSTTAPQTSLTTAVKGPGRPPPGLHPRRVRELPRQVEVRPRVPAQPRLEPRQRRVGQQGGESSNRPLHPPCLTLLSSAPPALPPSPFTPAPPPPTHPDAPKKKRRRGAILTHPPRPSKRSSVPRPPPTTPGRRSASTPRP